MASDKEVSKICRGIECHSSYTYCTIYTMIISEIKKKKKIRCSFNIAIWSTETWRHSEWLGTFSARNEGLGTLGKYTRFWWQSGIKKQLAQKEGFRHPWLVSQAASNYFKTSPLKLLLVARGKISSKLMLQPRERYFNPAKLRWKQHNMLPSTGRETSLKLFCLRQNSNWLQ